MNPLNQIVIKIIKEQELIMGPIAWEQAKKVNGLQVTNHTEAKIVIEGVNAKEVVDMLVQKYSELFGKAAIEASKEAVGSLIADLSPAEVPSSLR